MDADNIIVNEIQNPEVTQTWNKFASSAKKAGFRDGAAHGKDQVFQKSFDEGYFEGFRNGFAIGKYKGVSRINSKEPHNDQYLEHSRRGWCQICKNDNLMQSTTPEIKEKQAEFSNSLLKNLHLKYSSNTSVRLQNKLE